MQTGQTDDILRERVHKEALAAGGIFAGSRHKKPSFGRSHAADMACGHLLRHPHAAHSDDCPLGGKAEEPEPGEHEER